VFEGSFTTSLDLSYHMSIYVINRKSLQNSSRYKLLPALKMANENRTV